jgi:hypothetical protein
MVTGEYWFVLLPPMLNVGSFCYSDAMAALGERGNATHLGVAKYGSSHTELLMLRFHSLILVRRRGFQVTQSLVILHTLRLIPPV